MWYDDKEELMKELMDEKSVSITGDNSALSKMTKMAKESEQHSINRNVESQTVLEESIVNNTAESILMSYYDIKSKFDNVIHTVNVTLTNCGLYRTNADAMALLILSRNVIERLTSFEGSLLLEDKSFPEECPERMLDVIDDAYSVINKSDFNKLNINEALKSAEADIRDLIGNSSYNDAMKMAGRKN